jgi:hypothetical protein
VVVAIADGTEIKAQDNLAPTALVAVVDLQLLIVQVTKEPLAGLAAVV